MAILDEAGAAFLAARDTIAGSALAFAELKNVPLAIPQAILLADAVARGFAAETLAAFAKTANPLEHPAILSAIDARLDELAALTVILTFARVGGLAPPPEHDIPGFVAGLVNHLPPPAPGPLGHRWPDVAAWEEIAAARFGVAAPADRASFGAMVVANMGHC